MSPASYLTAPPRVARSIIATPPGSRAPAEGRPRGAVSIAAVWIVAVVALVLALALVVAAGVFAGLRGLRLWRDFKGFSATVGAEAAKVGEGADRFATRAEQLAEGGSPRLAHSMARLQISRARLQTLLHAWQGARDEVTDFVFIPRK
jgi:hypothetical protein